MNVWNISTNLVIKFFNLKLPHKYATYSSKGVIEILSSNKMSDCKVFLKRRTIHYR